MTEHSFAALGPNGFHQVAYVEWGDPANERVVLCVHGLTRNGRDFDFLARALAEDFRVVCPDVAGRGKSQWLSHKADYNYHVYASDMAALIARLGVPKVDWIGTSMGGLIGMFLTAQPGAPIRKFVINDIGPFIPKSALGRIGEYVGKDPRFHEFDDVVAYFKKTSAPFGPLTEDQWRHIAKYGSERRPDGQYSLRYDPGIVETYHAGSDHDIDLWPIWERVSCPTLLVRGADSDTLPRETAEEMTRRGPKAELLEFAGVGHAPVFMDPGQIEPIRAWLLR